jgi:glycosyltransferase involved in cell wall biosynthesis
MRVLILSEHYFPIVGGTTFLTKNICEAIARQGVEVWLVVPSPEPENSEETIGNLTTVRIGIGSSYTVDLERRQRLLFLSRASETITRLIDECSITAFHVLVGLYAMKHIDIDLIRQKGVKTIATIINVPPQECGTSWDGAKWTERVKDSIRKRIVKEVNKRRILAHEWDHYFTISDCGRKLLSAYLPDRKIEVAPLGCDPANKTLINRSLGEPLKLLTVAGYLPHKNQHLIPLAAKLLREHGVSFVWQCIGPVRNDKYYQYVRNLIKKHGVSDEIVIHTQMPQQELYNYYRNSDVYIQPSLEEGFCMTALDSVLFSLPLIGVRGYSGAIAEFVNDGRGIMINNSPQELADAIMRIKDNPAAYLYSQPQLDSIVHKYDWHNVVKGYIKAYLN